MVENLPLGKQVNKRRIELGLSLRDLAKKTNLTASFLSQLERGLTRSSLKSLQRISDALGVPLHYLLSENPSRSPVVRASNRAKLDLNDARVSYELLTPDLTGKLEALLGNSLSGGEIIVRSLNIETEEFIFVLEGVLVVGFKDQEYQLNMGDSITFNGRDLTTLTCGSDGKTRWISVITPPVIPVGNAT
jgi:transcriptional regulator with XRE-family HTH domain